MTKISLLSLELQVIFTHSTKEVNIHAKATDQPLIESHSTTLTTPRAKSSAVTFTSVSLVIFFVAISSPANPGSKILLAGIPETVRPVNALQSIASDIDELPPSYDSRSEEAKMERKRGRMRASVR
jgi:hypothetical protein